MTRPTCYRFLAASLVLTLSACASGPRPDPAKDPNCLADTGTRIPSNCVAGRTITREELERTGSMNLAEALARSVPSIRRIP